MSITDPLMRRTTLTTLHAGVSSGFVLAEDKTALIWIKFQGGELRAQVISPPFSTSFLANEKSRAQGKDKPKIERVVIDYRARRSALLEKVQSRIQDENMKRDLITARARFDAQIRTTYNEDDKLTLIDKSRQHYEINIAIQRTEAQNKVVRAREALANRTWTDELAPALKIAGVPDEIISEIAKETRLLRPPLGSRVEP